MCIWWPAFILRLLPPSVAVLLKKNITQVKKGCESVVKTFTTFTENNAGNDVRVGLLFLPVVLSVKFLDLLKCSGGKRFFGHSVRACICDLSH